MSYTTNDDNAYENGTIVFAKVDPGLKLVIIRYFQRIYYCAVVDDPQRKPFAYYERELIPARAVGSSQHDSSYEVNRTLIA